MVQVIGESDVALLHSVAPKVAARLQMIDMPGHGHADQEDGGQKQFESNSRRKAILPPPFPLLQGAGSREI
jgi:hypothetical protein